MGLIVCSNFGGSNRPQLIRGCNIDGSKVNSIWPTLILTYTMGHYTKVQIHDIKSESREPNFKFHLLVDDGLQRNGIRPAYVRIMRFAVVSPIVCWLSKANGSSLEAKSGHQQPSDEQTTELGRIKNKIRQ